MPFTVEGLTDEVGDLKDALSNLSGTSSTACGQHDKNETAKHLGIGVSSLYRKLEELNIPKASGRRSTTPPAS